MQGQNIPWPRTEIRKSETAVVFKFVKLAVEIVFKFVELAVEIVELAVEIVFKFVELAVEIVFKFVELAVNLVFKSSYDFRQEPRLFRNKTLRYN